MTTHHPAIHAIALVCLVLCCAPGCDGRQISVNQDTGQGTDGPVSSDARVTLDKAVSHDAGRCAAMDARGVGNCAMALGIAWNGADCVFLGGCSCQGTDCKKLFKSQSNCLATYSHCITASCAPMDAAGEGTCDMFIGYFWRGKKCSGASGCSCKGKDCKNAYGTKEACQKAHAHCPGVRTPASGTCIKNRDDACSSDKDCASGGCGGELCYNPAMGGGASDCDCGPPQGVTCGCVASKCTWWK